MKKATMQKKTKSTATKAFRVVVDGKPLGDLGVAGFDNASESLALVVVRVRSQSTIVCTLGALRKQTKVASVAIADGHAQQFKKVLE